MDTHTHTHTHTITHNHIHTCAFSHINYRSGTGLHYKSGKYCKDIREPLIACSSTRKSSYLVQLITQSSLFTHCLYVHDVLLYKTHYMQMV